MKKSVIFLGILVALSAIGMSGWQYQTISSGDDLANLMLCSQDISGNCVSGPKGGIQWKLIQDNSFNFMVQVSGLMPLTEYQITIKRSNSNYYSVCGTTDRNGRLFGNHNVAETRGVKEKRDVIISKEVTCGMGLPTNVLAKNKEYKLEYVIA